VLASFFTKSVLRPAPCGVPLDRGGVAAYMTDQLSPLARLFRGMADLIDQDRISPTHHGAILTAAGVATARASAEGRVSGRLWEDDGGELLAAAYAFHAGLSRQAAVATHVRAMEEAACGMVQRPGRNPRRAPPTRRAGA
jgi:hypothetical protein